MNCKQHQVSQHKSYWFFLMLFFYSFALFSQNTTEIKNILDSKIPINEKHNKVLLLLQEWEISKKDSLYVGYQDFAYWYFNVSKDSAVFYEQKALEIAERKNPLPKEFVQKSAVYLGFYLEQTNQRLKAISYYKKSLRHPHDQRLVLNAYQNIGYNYTQIGDYYNAIPYYQYVIKLLNERSSVSELYFMAHQNLGLTAVNLQTEESFKIAKKSLFIADSLFDIIGTNNRQKFNIKFGLAQLHNQHRNLNIPVAATYYQAALRIAKESKDSTRIGNVYYGLGSLYNTTDAEKSIKNFKKAAPYFHKDDSLNNYYINNGMATTYARINEFDVSIDYREKALFYLLGKEVSDHQNLPVETLVNSSYIDNNLTGIQGLAQTYLKQYEVEGDKLQLEKSISYFKWADYATDLLRANSSAFRSRLFWREIATNLYGKAIRACYLANDVELAFYFMEKSKAILLLEDLSKKQYELSQNLTKSTQDSIRTLKIEIAEIQSLLQLHKDQTPDDSSLQGSLVEKKLQLDELIGNNNNILAPDLQILSLKELQSSLQKKEVVLEYYVSKDDGFDIISNNKHGYLLFIDKEHSELIELKNRPKIEQVTIALLDAIKRPFITQEDVENYQKVSQDLFDQLIPEDIYKKIQGKKLRIIPDSFLSFLPFEALYIPNTTQYLIETNTISYQYSNSFYHSIPKQKIDTGRFLALVPEEFPDSNLTSLTYSPTEVVALSKNYKGKVLAKSLATKDNFLEQLQEYNILHLATHANAQDSINPWIAFYDQKISLDEIYVTPNNAHLVFLSGCNTSTGKLASGEGLMSLSRGFFQSGATSIVASLWQIDDKASAFLVDDFYKNLSQGNSKTDALRQAKINYLNTHDLSERSPYYWASLVFLGDESPIEGSKNNWLWYLLIPSILLLIYLLRKNL